ncbi:MAG: hypothetical protein GEU98_25360 [Pseudonocardiaceae bacterium]|nr:hypothetical protein [Pseudonocardiaceae bacterium]
MPLDIKVEAKPNDIRATAASLRQLSAATHGSGTDVRAASGLAESGGWRGPASDGFRSAMRDTGDGIDKVANNARGLREALDRHADDIDTVKARMKQARGIASEGGLEVSDTTIFEPGPAPPSPKPLPADRPCTEADARAHTDAVDAQQAYIKKVKAYHEANKVISEARQIETKSQDELNRFIDGLVKAAPFSISSFVTSLAGATAAQSSTHRAAASTFRETAATFVRKLGSVIPADAAGIRHVALQYSLFTTAANAAEQRAADSRLKRAVDRLPRWAKKHILGNVTRYIPEGSPVLGRAVPPLKHVTNSGTLLTAAGIAADISAGTNPVKAVASGVGAFAAGTGYAVGATALGTPVGWAAALGAGASYGTGQFIDRWWERVDNQEYLETQADTSLAIAEAERNQTENRADAARAAAELDQHQTEKRGDFAGAVGQAQAEASTVYEGTVDSDEAPATAPGFAPRVIG